MKAMALEDSEWMADAIATIIGLAHSQDLITADDVNRELRKPPVANWMGIAFTTAKREGHIEAVDYRTSTSKTRKHGALRTWRRKEQEQAA